MDAERLEKLNAYLISKGRPPKQLHQNFVKSNVSSIKRTTLSQQNGEDPHKKYPGSIDAKKKVLNLKKNSNVAQGKKSKENNPLRNFHSKPDINKMKEKSSVQANRFIKKSSNVMVKSLHKPVKKINTMRPHRLQEQSKPVTPNHSVVAAKKLLRRSMNASFNKSIKKGDTLSCSSPSLTSKMLMRKRFLSQSAKPTRTSSCLFRRNSKTPGSYGKATQHERQQRLEQLRSWMKSKGKDPSTLCGFKPIKSMLTPVHSPVKNSPARLNDSSQWPSLRDQDYHDELSILVKKTMKEAKECLEGGCAAEDIHSQLVGFHNEVPVVERHASYWITLALVYEKLGKDGNEILALFEQAVKKHAQPLDDIKQALRDFVTSKVNEPTNERNDHTEGPKTPIPIPSFSKLDNAQDVDSMKMTPEKKRVFSFPINSMNPHTQANMQPLSPLITGCPSSVVKLRMIPKSSPVFKKLLARKALTSDVSAIITPVRRSKRIEDSKWKYPKQLIARDPCITTPRELMEPDVSERATTSKDFLFDRNDALGDDYADIATLLKF